MTQHRERGNRLTSETSPYLQQHATNPVDWHPWGAEAFELAERDDRPVFLSIGYSACHWCHVMAHESFDDRAIADFLNEHFVSIKVDREERPDLDAIYMNAVVAMTGRGGWPMSVFLTPDQRPFFGGTYWPPRSAHGTPGFIDILHHIVHAWRERRDEVERAAQSLVDAVRTMGQPPGEPQPLGPEILARAAGDLRGVRAGPVDRAHHAEAEERVGRGAQTHGVADREAQALGGARLQREIDHLGLSGGRGESAEEHRTHESAHGCKVSRSGAAVCAAGYRVKGCSKLR